MVYVLLLVAIIAEVIATTALKTSASFTKLVPSLVVLGGYGVSFYLMSLVMRTLPTGITYAIWAGLGIVLITTIGVVFLKEKLDFAAILGLFLIVLGVVVINVFSKTVTH